MTNKEYAELIVPNIEHDNQYYKAMYKKRVLPDNAVVTRFAPSPTGSMHIGNLLSAIIATSFARQTNGIAFLRIEDTDQKREVEGGSKVILDTLDELNINFDESIIKGGEYGPYLQSERRDIYRAFARMLIEEDKAYPCFCTPEELTNIRENQEKKKMRLGYYGKYAKYRDLSRDEVIEKINNGEEYIIRFKSMGSFYNKVTLHDKIRGDIEFPENDRDEVILKSDGLPTYHFAHAVDDTLMGTNLVVRGDEWVSSFPIHEQLFTAIGSKLPDFAHISPINIKDNGATRKISKRKDPWANVSYYNEAGIPDEVIKLYLTTLANSNFEEWYNQNIDKKLVDFDFSFNTMSVTGPIFDMDKLLNISKTYFSRLTAKDIYNSLLIYTSKYDVDFNKLITLNKEYTINLLNIERNVNKPRKDIATYKDIKDIYWYMYDELFDNTSKSYEDIDNITRKDVINYIENVYKDYSSQEEWFPEVADYANAIGFTSDRKAFKAEPDKFKGTTADFCKALRIIVTTKNMSPNLFDLITLLGKDKLIERTNAYFDTIK